MLQVRLPQFTSHKGKGRMRGQSRRVGRMSQICQVITAAEGGVFSLKKTPGNSSSEAKPPS